MQHDGAGRRSAWGSPPSCLSRTNNFGDPLLPFNPPSHICVNQDTGPRRRNQGNRIWKFRGGSPSSLSPGRRARGRRFLSSPLQGGGREGGLPLGAPASRRPRAKRERGCGSSARQAGGTPAHPGGSRMSRIGKVPSGPPSPRVNPPPDLPPEGGRREDPGGGEKTARPTSLFGHRERSPTGDPDPPSRERSEDGLSSTIALPAQPPVVAEFETAAPGIAAALPAHPSSASRAARRR